MYHTLTLSCIPSPSYQHLYIHTQLPLHLRDRSFTRRAPRPQRQPLPPLPAQPVRVSYISIDKYVRTPSHSHSNHTSPTPLQNQTQHSDDPSSFFLAPAAAHGRLLTPHCTPTSLRALLRKCLRTVNLAAYIRGFLRRVWQEGGRRLGPLAFGAFMCVSICMCTWFFCFPSPHTPTLTHTHSPPTTNNPNQNRAPSPPRSRAGGICGGGAGVGGRPMGWVDRSVRA